MSRSGQVLHSLSEGHTSGQRLPDQEGAKNYLCVPVYLETESPPQGQHFCMVAH